MFNLKSKIDTRLEARRNGESGLALLDVLLGMAIFALIAVIAVQAMGTFRSRAYVTAATSDARQLATGIESYLTDSVNATPPPVSGSNYAAFPNSGTGASRSAQTPLGVNLTNGNLISNYALSGQDYTFCIVKDATATDATGAEAWVEYSSASGAIVRSGTGAPTSASVAAGSNCD